METYSSVLAWRTPWTVWKGKKIQNWKVSLQVWRCIIASHWTVDLHFPKVKNLPTNAGYARDVGLIPGSGRSPGVGNGNPLQYSCLKTPMNREGWWVAVHGVAKSWMPLSDCISTSAVIDDVENLLRCSFAICISLVNYLFISFTNFYSGFF